MISTFPDCVPSLIEPVSGLTLRAHNKGDLEAIVEQSRDPVTQRWTTVPMPEGGYSVADARTFALEVIPQGWESGTSLSWAIENRGDYAGTVELRLHGDGIGEVAFVLHPLHRGQGLMSAAVRLVVAYGFDVADLEAIRWLAEAGNWGSRRVAAAAGFRYDGLVRRMLPHRGRLVDAWVATITSDDARAPLRTWHRTPVLVDPAIRLRPWTDGDAARVAEACADERTAYWLVSLPQPYTEDDALAFMDHTREEAAAGRGYNWCVTDPDADICLGSISLTGFGGYARRCEIGYWAHPDARGRGAITEAVRLVTAFAEDGRVDSLEIRVGEGNAASRHVAEAAGFEYAGTLPHSEPVGDGTRADLHILARP